MSQSQIDPKHRKERRKSSGAESGSGPERQQRRSRASGEILELLVAEFNKSSNPASAVRKAISAKTGMSERSVRIWFQNRRAKQRKLEKQKKEREGGGAGAATAAAASAAAAAAATAAAESSALPIDINDKYSLIDCRSLAVGQWQRIRSGQIQSGALTELHNLSPQYLNGLLDATDLLVILSKKDHELNYFFSGVFQAEKVLFRIFFPVVNVVRTSFIDNQTQKIGTATAATPQLQMELSAPPKFAVHFLKDPSTGQPNANQWSICEDFSENQQVATAYLGEGGSSVPHILTGSLSHLHYLSTAIASYCQLLAAHSSFPGPSSEPQLFGAGPVSAVDALPPDPQDTQDPQDPLDLTLPPYTLDPFQPQVSVNPASMFAPQSTAPDSLALAGLSPMGIDLPKDKKGQPALAPDDLIKIDSPDLDLFQNGDLPDTPDIDAAAKQQTLLLQHQLQPQQQQQQQQLQQQQQQQQQQKLPSHRDPPDFESSEFFMDDGVSDLGF